VLAADLPWNRLSREGSPPPSKARPLELPPPAAQEDPVGQASSVTQTRHQHLSPERLLLRLLLGVYLYVMKAELAQAFEHDKVEGFAGDASHAALGLYDHIHRYVRAGSAER